MSVHQTTPNLSTQDYFTTTLTGNVGVSDTVINLAAVPTGSEGILVIDPSNASTREIIYFNSKGAGTVTCPDANSGSGRGLGGTTVQTHTSGTTVAMNFTSEHFSELQNGNANSGLVNLIKSLAASYVVSGLTIATSASLTSTITSGVCYINGKRFALNSASITVTASKDTYVDIKENGDGTTTVVQAAVSNGASAPAITTNSDGSNALRIAKLVSSGSAITSSTQTGKDSNGVWIYPTNGSTQASFKYRQSSTVGDSSWVGAGATLATGLTLTDTSQKSVFFQGGVINTSTSQDAFITFPTPYTQNPLVVCSVIGGFGGGTTGVTQNAFAEVIGNVTLTGCSVRTFNTSGGQSNQAVAWLSFGQ